MTYELLDHERNEIQKVPGALPFYGRSRQRMTTRLLLSSDVAALRTMLALCADAFEVQELPSRGPRHIEHLPLQKGRPWL